MVRKTLARILTVTAVSAAVTAGLPGIALAEPAGDLQSQLDQANARLDDLYAQASTVSEQVNQTKSDLDETNAQIEQKKTELDAAQATLADRVSADYKTGGVSLISLVFQANSFDDLVSRVSYASKVTQSDAEAIQQVKDLQADLSSKQAEQQQLLDQQVQQQSELDGKVAEAESYTSSLDAQVQQALAEQQAARAAEQQAAQQQAEQQAAENGGFLTEEEREQADETPAGDDAAADTTAPEQGQTPSKQEPTHQQPADDPEPETPSHNGSSSSNSSVRDAIVAAAWSKVGSSYVYGATGPNAFDCSGFVQWCYARAGISLGRTSGDQGSTGTTTSNPQKGDIVCWSGHVGIYIGGGMMIDAGNLSTGVSYREVYGSPWYQSVV